MLSRQSDWGLGLLGCLLSLQMTPSEAEIKKYNRIA